MKKPKFERYESVELRHLNIVGMIDEIYLQEYPLVASDARKYVYRIYVGNGKLICEEESNLKGLKERF